MPSPVGAAVNIRAYLDQAVNPVLQKALVELTKQTKYEHMSARHQVSGDACAIKPRLIERAQRQHNTHTKRAVDPGARTRPLARCTVPPP